MLVELKSRNIWFPTGIVEAVYLLAIYVRLSDPYVAGVATIPPSYLVPFMHRCTVAEFRVHLDAFLASKGSAEIHAAKFHFSLVPFAPEMVKGREVSPFSNDWMALANGMKLSVRNTANNADVPIPPAADMATNSTTHYTARNIFWKGDNPSFINRVLQWFATTGGSNGHGSVFLIVVEAVAEKISVVQIAYNGTTWASCTLASPVVNFIPVIVQNVDLIIAGVTTVQQDITFAMINCSPGTFTGLCKGKTLQDSWCDQFFDSMVRGGEILQMGVDLANGRENVQRARS
jgi:hypothetical protein